MSHVRYTIVIHEMLSETSKSGTNNRDHQSPSISFDSGPIFLIILISFLNIISIIAFIKWLEK